MNRSKVIAYLEENYFSGSFHDVEQNGLCYVTADFDETTVEGYMSVTARHLRVDAKVSTSVQDLENVKSMVEDDFELVDYVDPSTDTNALFIRKEVPLEGLDETNINETYDAVFDKVMDIWENS